MYEYQPWVFHNDATVEGKFTHLKNVVCCNVLLFHDKRKFPIWLDHSAEKIEFFEFLFKSHQAAKNGCVNRP
jgi:hypothetical protein